jgi:hypothetical protein
LISSRTLMIVNWKKNHKNPDKWFMDVDKIKNYLK